MPQIYRRRTPWDEYFPTTWLPEDTAPPPISPSGSYICPPLGTLVTSAGRWRWGAGSTTTAGDLLLNGDSQMPSCIQAYCRQSGPQSYLFARDSTLQWYLFVSVLDWVVVNPNDTPPPCP
jgi:hypothetical protein